MNTYIVLVRGRVAIAMFNADSICDAAEQVAKLNLIYLDNTTIIEVCVSGSTDAFARVYTAAGSMLSEADWLPALD